MKDNNENQLAILYKFNSESIGNWNKYKVENYSVKEMQNKHGKLRQLHLYPVGIGHQIVVKKKKMQLVKTSQPFINASHFEVKKKSLSNNNDLY